MFLLFLISILLNFKPLSNHTQHQCAFCDKNVLNAQKFYEDDLALAIYNYKNATLGHCLIIPKRHVERFEELSSEEHAALFELIKKVHHASSIVFHSKDYLLYQKNGRRVGQSVPHLHFHYVPRKNEDNSIISFIFNILAFPLKAPLSNEELADYTTKLKQAIET